ncbi:MAG: ATP-binding protein [Gammaproteobacteria bacterium]|nr:ATP-binding protein [Gammaproteobacteria bacterium]
MLDERRKENLTQEQFTVDAALLRELGERLIGRAHIALAELVKNSFDADAHTCRIDLEDDRIVVSDDGHGISPDEFLKYWMRIGTTHKVDSRQSRHLGRPMTGSKGLGRLSVQFLADEMELESSCAADPGSMLYAYVDWRSIRVGADLHTVEVGWETISERSTYADGSGVGTRITLTGLRTEWDEAAIEGLGKDVWMLRSPFRTGRGKTKGRTALDFYVELEAPEISSARERFDKLHDALFENWKARITGVLQDGRRPRNGSEAKVVVEFAPDYPEGVDGARTFRETVSFPVIRKEEESADGEDKAVEDSDGAGEEAANKAALDKARFTILVFKPEGRQSGLSVGEMRDYLRTYGGVSVYDAGFRLPYYGSQDLSGHDWLNVGVDQGRRLNASELLPERFRIAGRYLLDLPNPGRIFGAVDVDTNHEHRVVSARESGGGWLQIQPGRDRLAPNESFEQLRNLVRFGLDLYANRYRAVADDEAQKQHAKEPPPRALGTALATLQRYKPEMPDAAYREVRRDIVRARRAVETQSGAIDSRAALLGPLATAGMAALAMNHELTNDAALLDELTDLLEALSESQPSETVTEAIRSLKTYKTHFNAYRGLFAPLADADERVATERLTVESVVGQVVRSLRSRLAGVAFGTSAIPRDLRFPVGAFAEWSAVLQNMMFNAWNAMLESDVRVIRFDGSQADARRQYLRVSDTGSGLTMSIEETGILFEAFERRGSVSPANRSIAIGGQGLGLAIVRMIASSRGAEVGFVRPPSGFSTAIQLSWRT